MTEQSFSGGERIRQFFSAEATSLLTTYRNIQRLLPAPQHAGAAHAGEEGRHIESLLRAFLNRHLPQSLRALSGFILRPSTKAGDNDERRKHLDEHSRQIDVIVYDVDRFPVYERYEEFAIVPPEGVIGIISIKKQLYTSQVRSELGALSEAVSLCRHQNPNGEWVRGPNAALVAFSAPDPDPTKTMKRVFDGIRKYSSHQPFDRLVGQVIVLDSWSIFKSRPYPMTEEVDSASYVGFQHCEDEAHLGVQFLLSGILSVYYDRTRRSIARPGFTAFQLGRTEDQLLGDVPVRGLRCRDPEWIE